MNVLKAAAIAAAQQEIFNSTRIEQVRELLRKDGMVTLRIYMEK